jgi:hypothetical protein
MISLGNLAERDNLFHRAARDRLFRHAEHDAALLILRTRRSAELTHFQKAARTVVAHSGHDDPERVTSGILRGRAKQDVG